MGISVLIIQLEIDEASPFIDIGAACDMAKIPSSDESNKLLPENLDSSKAVTLVEGKKLRGKRSSNVLIVETHKKEAVSSSESALETIPFFSGNPFVEKTNGILHIYKSNSSCDPSKFASKTICILAVPASLSSHDLLQFLAPCGSGITLIRIIRDNTPNQYMVLVTFHEKEQVDDFYRTLNGKAFNTLEPEQICHLVYVAKVETKKLPQAAGLPIEGHTELPTCPVCLERMDESVDGILTVLCNHSFHASCLNQWGDTSCPVCRYMQTPELTADHSCSVCGKNKDLWICLICGTIGCGRYAEAHAVLHFQETQHTFALEIGGQRVWDYAGDNYVHRLIQSKSDGKLVEFDNSDESIPNDEKMDGITLEYTYLLTNQLESQRLYFEDKVANVEKLAAAEIDKLQQKVIELDGELNHLKQEFKKCTNEKATLDKKLQQSSSKLQKYQQEAKEERELNAILRQDQTVWAGKMAELEKKLESSGQNKDKEIQDLQEQLRDLMFHFEAESKLKQATEDQSATKEEIQDSHVIIGDQPNNNKKGRKKK